MAASPEQFGPYLVHERLGAGGMATVHRAVRTGLEGFERPVALKRLLDALGGDPDFVKSFVREARLAVRLGHPNIAQTLDLGRVGHTYYIAMELIEGRDLRQVVQHAARSVGPLPPPIVIALVGQICDALDYAHELADESGKRLGLVHRDISPSNVIVGHDGVVKLIDFGIAKASSTTLMTAGSSLKGKYGYIAPESLTDGPGADARGDLFGVGVVAWELLTARPLFRGATDLDTLEQVRKVAAPAPSRYAPMVPQALDAIVLRALDKDPARRWPSAAALRAALTELTRDPALRATTVDVAQWIGWAMAQPAQAWPWEEVVSGATESLEIEIGPRTLAGVGLSPMRPRPPSAPPTMAAPFRAEAPQPVPPPRPSTAKPGSVPPQRISFNTDAPTIAADSPAVVDIPTQLAVQPMPQDASPLANPEYLAAAAAYNAAEERREQMIDVVSLPTLIAPRRAAPDEATRMLPSAPVTASVPSSRSPRSAVTTMLLVLLLCAIAAGLGFFLVDTLL